MIDVGANLLNRQFRRDLDEVLARAWAAGLSHILVTATDLEDAEGAIALCARHSGLACTAGLHPHLAKDAPDGWLDRLKALAASPWVRAIGETGLDFNRNHSPRPAQQAVFQAQIQLAGQLGMPLFVHDRDTNGAVFEMLRSYAGRPDQVLIHCFTGSAADLRRYLAAGYSIGITGWLCDEVRGAELRRLAPSIPLDRLLIETDAPFLLPAGAVSPTKRKRRNEPCLLPAIAERLAAVRSISVEELILSATQNAQRLFGLN